MAKSPYAPVAHFDSVVPPDVLRAIGKCVLQAYPESWSSLQDQALPRGALHDTLPHARRALIERNLVRLPLRAIGLVAQETRNIADNAYHTLLQYRTVRLTVHSVGGPGEMVRDAHFRRQYARSSQIDAFEQALDIPPHAELYAFVLHIPARSNAAAPGRRWWERPAQLLVRFPDDACREYVGEAIDLYARFPDLVAQDVAEHAVAKPEPRLTEIDEAQGQ